MLTSEKHCPLSRACLFCAPSARLKRAWPSVLDAKKPARLRWLFACAERPRFELGDQKIGHSLAGCCITTLPPLQNPHGQTLVCDFGEGKNSEILYCTATHAKGVCILAVQMSTRTFSRIQKLNNTMKKLLFLGAFALFAFAASAQSTQGPADKKAKTEQTCSRMPKRLRAPKVTKPPATSPSRGMLLKGAMLPRTPRRAFASLHLRMLQQVRQRFCHDDDKKEKSKKKDGDKTSG